MDVLQATRQCIEGYQLVDYGESIVVGVSGGPDSLCLLHVLLRLAPELPLKLHVAHLNHGLRGAEADADAAFIQEIAAAWGLSCTIESVDVASLAQQPGLSIEEAARNARYAFLGRLAAQLGSRTVAVGHNADDQAETILMHWLRGSGLAGLRGMRPETRLESLRLAAVDCKLQAIRLIRPLLFVPRNDIERYCREQGLTPRYDRSNEDLTYFRNRLRHELLPLLETYNPRIRRILRHSAEVIAGDYDLLRVHLLETWPQVALTERAGQIIFDLAGWRAAPTSLQRSLLREAISRLRSGLRNIDFIHVENARRLLQEGETGERMTLPAGLEVTLGYDRFALGDAGLELPAGDAPQLTLDRLALAAPGITRLPGSRWQVAISLLDPADLPAGWTANADPWQAWLDAEVVGLRPILRVRRPGDRFQPLGLAGGSKGLGEFFTNEKVPASARHGWPLLIGDDGEIAWVCGLRIDQRARVAEHTKQVLAVRFERPNR